MRFAMAGLLGLVAPGAGHAFLGRRRAALLFGLPVLVLLAGLLVLYLQDGFTAILEFLVTPGVLPFLAVVNVLLAVWRIAAAVDASRATRKPRETAAILGPAILVLVLLPQLWAGATIAAADDFLNTMFAAAGPGASQPPDQPLDTPPPGWTFDPGGDEGTPEPIPTDDPSAAPTGPVPTKYPRVPADPGSSGNLPGLGVAVPWTRPGSEPWGNDTRFDLLLLGSDAGRDRWSRRMDVMLLVEIDTVTGKVSMVGLPRNLVNAPFPPGAARNAVACGCFQDMLNALYVEATVRHPDRWPGVGAVAGIGAVRATVSELTKRPVDAVLVADLWGVIKVVDAMGGIDIDVPYRVYDSHYPDPVYGTTVLDISAGHHHFDGRLALAYARSRHQDSDYGRMQRQQTFLLAVRKDIGPQTILDAPDLFAAAKGFTWTDLPRDSLPNLVNLFSKAQTASVKQLRIVPPTYPSWLTSAEVTKIRKDIANLLGVPVPPTPSPVPSPSPSPTLGPPSPTLGPPSPTAPPPTGTPPPPSDTPAPSETPGPT